MFAKNTCPMHTTLSAKLALVFSRVFAYSNRVDIDDYFQGKYDLDTVFERFNDIKAAVSNAINTSTYPYSDPEVQCLMKIGIKMTDDEINNMRTAARALGNVNMKFSEYLLHKDVDLDSKIEKLTTHGVFIRIFSPLCTNPATRRDYLKINEEGMRSNIEWLAGIKQRKDAGASWGH